MGKKFLFFMLIFSFLVSCSVSCKQKGSEIKAQSNLVVSFGYGIYIMNEDGTNKKKITDGILPKFSPDGKKIVYTGKDKSADKYFDKVYTFDIITKEKTKIANGGEPEFSPDGKRVVFVDWLEGKSKKTVTGTEEEDYIPGENEPTVYLKTVDTNGANKLKIAAGPVISNPTSTPDGSYIYFDTSGGPVVESTIYKVKSDGSEAKSGFEKYTAIIKGDYPKISPDGKKMLYLFPTEKDRNLFGLGVYDFETKKTNNILKPEQWLGYPVWSPAGKKVAVVIAEVTENNEFKRYKILIVSVDNPQDIKTFEFSEVIMGIDWR